MSAGDFKERLDNGEKETVSHDDQSDDADDDFSSLTDVQDANRCSNIAGSLTHPGGVSNDSGVDSDTSRKIAEMFDNVDFSDHQKTLQSLAELKSVLQGNVRQIASSLRLGELRRSGTFSETAATLAEIRPNIKRKRVSRSKKLQGLSDEEAEQRRLRTNLMEKRRMHRQSLVVKKLEGLLPDCFKGDNENLTLINTLKLSTHFIWLLDLLVETGTSLDSPAFQLGVDLIKNAMESKWQNDVIDFASFSHLFEQKRGALFSSLKEDGVFNLREVLVSCSAKHSNALLHALHRDAAAMNDNSAPDGLHLPSLPAPNDLHLPSLSVSQPSASHARGRYPPLVSNHRPTWPPAPHYGMPHSHGPPPTGQAPTFTGSMPQPDMGSYPRFSPIQQNQVSGPAGIQHGMCHTKALNSTGPPSTTATPSYHDPTSVPDMSHDFVQLYNSSAHENSEANSSVRHNNSSCRYAQNAHNIIMSPAGTASTLFQFTPPPEIPAMSSHRKRSCNVARAVNSPHDVSMNEGVSNQHEINAPFHPLPIQIRALMHPAAPSLNATSSDSNNFTNNPLHRIYNGGATHHHTSLVNPMSRTPLSELGPNTQDDSGIGTDLDTSMNGTPRQFTRTEAMAPQYSENHDWPNQLHHQALCPTGSLSEFLNSTVT